MIRTFDIYLSFIVAITIYAAFNINPNQFWGWNDDVYNLFDEDYQDVAGYETLGFGLSTGIRYKLK